MNRAIKRGKRGLQKQTKERIMIDKEGWLLCPVCKRRVLRLRPDTTAHNLPVYCKRCRRETIVNIDQSLRA